MARPMWHGTRLFGLIVPEGRKGRKGKNEEKRGPDRKRYNGTPYHRVPLYLFTNKEILNNKLNIIIT